jgi:membrane associated rhomboid family serine protease
MDIKRIFQTKRIQIIFLLIGAVGGFLYWRFVGCTSGTCAIKSVWYWTTLWGAAMGYLVGDFVNDIIQKRKIKKGEEK